MAYKNLISAASILLTFIAFVPYILSILKGHTRPHVFSWIVWGAATVIVFFAQLTDKGGAGAWPIGVSGGLTLLVAALAYFKRADRGVTRLDWLFLIAAFGALALWFVTKDPLAAVVILTVVDTLGFGPTFRKAYAYPFEEDLLFFFLIALRNGLAIAALEHYSWTTVLFPAVMALACLMFIAMVLWRRSILDKKGYHPETDEVTRGI